MTNVGWALARLLALLGLNLRLLGLLSMLLLCLHLLLMDALDLGLRNGVVMM